MRIVLTTPGECIPIFIRNRGAYVAYKAYFPHLEDKRLFNIVFKKSHFDRAIKAIPPKLRQELNRPVIFEFKKTGRSILIKNYRYVDAEVQKYLYSQSNYSNYTIKMKSKKQIERNLKEHEKEDYGEWSWYKGYVDALKWVLK